MRINEMFFDDIDTLNGFTRQLTRFLVSLFFTQKSSLAQQIITLVVL